MTDEQKAVERQNLIDILDRNFGYTDDEPAHVVADRLITAGYRKQGDTAREFAEKLKTELFANCVIIQTIYNPQKEDMDSSEAFQIINELAEKYGKED